MGYGKTKPDIDERSITERIENRNAAREVDKSIFKDMTDLSIDELNYIATDAYYQDNPSNRPDYDIKVVSKRNSKTHEGYTLLNQSLIKKLVNKYQEEEPFCPKYIKHCLIDGNKIELASDSMLAGKFFESMTLGGTTGGKLVTDLPRKAISKKRELELRAKGLPIVGEKRIDQERIEIQIERFKHRAKLLQTEIISGINTHVEIFKRWDDKYMLVGELDWFPTPIMYNGHYQLAIIDLKLTSNVETTFGKFCWGTPQFMDHLQADFYHNLVRDIDLELNPHLKNVLTDSIIHQISINKIVFLYWVWGYQKEPLNLQEKFVERTYLEENGSDYRQREMRERIRKAIAIIEREEVYGWQPNPIPDNCKYCSLNKFNGGNCELSCNTVI